MFGIFILHRQQLFLWKYNAKQYDERERRKKTSARARKLNLNSRICRKMDENPAWNILYFVIIYIFMSMKHGFHPLCMRSY